MSAAEPMPDDENINQKEGISIVKVRDVEYKLDIDDKIWKDGPEKFAQIPAWKQRGQIRPSSARGLPTSNNTKWLKKINPFKNFQIFPSVLEPSNVPICPGPLNDVFSANKSRHF